MLNEVFDCDDEGDRTSAVRAAGAHRCAHGQEHPAREWELQEWADCARHGELGICNASRAGACRRVPMEWVRGGARGQAAAGSEQVTFEAVCACGQRRSRPSLRWPARAEDGASEQQPLMPTSGQKRSQL